MSVCLHCKCGCDCCYHHPQPLLREMMDCYFNTHCLSLWLTQLCRQWVTLQNCSSECTHRHSQDLKPWIDPQKWKPSLVAHSLPKGNWQLEISIEVSCPLQMNCKHFAALGRLFAKTLREIIWIKCCCAPLNLAEEPVGSTGPFLVKGLWMLVSLDMCSPHHPPPLQCVTSDPGLCEWKPDRSSCGLVVFF